MISARLTSDGGHFSPYEAAQLGSVTATFLIWQVRGRAAGLRQQEARAAPEPSLNLP
jgi:hypothetical protein